MSKMSPKMKNMGCYKMKEKEKLPSHAIILKYVDVTTIAQPIPN
jgi:hypothetical protein